MFASNNFACIEGSHGEIKKEVEGLLYNEMDDMVVKTYKHHLEAHAFQAIQDNKNYLNVRNSLDIPNWLIGNRVHLISVVL